MTSSVVDEVVGMRELVLGIELDEREVSTARAVVAAAVAVEVTVIEHDGLISIHHKKDSQCSPSTHQHHRSQQQS